jgi:transketolase
MNDKDLMNKAADNIRVLAAAMVEKAKSGHPGGADFSVSFQQMIARQLVYSFSKKM